MSTWVRDGIFDCIVAAGPNLPFWPTIGSQTISSIGADFDLKMAVFGGESLRVVGALPLPETGAIALVQDVQNRIHRLQTRALVRIATRRLWPDPFKNWRSPAVIPLSTARKIDVNWSPCTVILGTGNEALRMGAELMEKGVREVYCIESFGQWGEKAYAGWEVEKRRFEMLGGRIIFGKPVSIEPKSAMQWELRVQDSAGVRIIETSWVICAGPFDDLAPVREYPAGSNLYEFENSADPTQAESVEGWMSEQFRAEALAIKLIRALKGNLSRDEREHLDRMQKRSKIRIKKIVQHRSKPHASFYQGKWTAALSAQQIRNFSGVPKTAQRKRLVASVECFENIACQACQKSCPESAIELTAARDRVLNEDACTACGACLPACPSGAVYMIQENENQPNSRMVFPVRSAMDGISVGGFVQLLNRRGEYLSNGRVVEVQPPQSGVVLVTVDVPAHLVWEARGLRRVPLPASHDKMMDVMSQTVEGRVEVTLLGQKRLVRESAGLSEILFETGRARGVDTALCNDGSCGLCYVDVDGVNKLACLTKVRKGMVVKSTSQNTGRVESAEYLCPCLEMTSESLVAKIQQGGLVSVDAVISVTGVGSGQCHGQICMSSVRRILDQQQIEGTQDWVDWRFPWADWGLVPVST